jgi:hypothetical protein
MARALLLYEMTPGAPLDGMMIAHEALHDTEVTQRIKDMTIEADLDSVFLILGHPAMQPDTGFIKFVGSFLVFSLGQQFDPMV